jgi:hypothetical protein
MLNKDSVTWASENLDVGNWSRGWKQLSFFLQHLNHGVWSKPCLFSRDSSLGVFWNTKLFEILYPF